MAERIEIGDTVHIRGGRTRWTVEDVLGGRAVLTHSDVTTDPPARVSDLGPARPEPDISQEADRV